MSFIGNAPAAIPTSFQAVQADSFNGNGSTTNFTLSRQITNLYDIEVLVDNVQQSPYDGSYSVNGTTITFSSAPGSGTNNIYIVYRDHPITSIQPKGDLTLEANLNVDGTVYANATLARDGGSDATINGVTPTSDNLMGRNRIINGDMRIDQRNAGAAVTSGYPVDRFQISNTSDGTFSAQQDSSAPAGFTKSLKVTITSADSSLTTTQRLMIVQQIEGYNVADFGFGTANAKTITLSFWVRSSLTGTFGGSLLNGGSNRSYPFTYSISAADTWEYKTITVAGDTTGTWATDNSSGMRVYIGLGAGPDVSGTAGAWAGANYASATGAVSVVGTNGATFYITGVQLEAGSVATSFERRPYGQELALCQRYALMIKNGTTSIDRFGLGSTVNTTTVQLLIQHPVAFRAAPTLTTTGTAADYQVYSTTVTTCNAAPTLGEGSQFNSRVNFVTAGGLTGGQVSQPVGANTDAFLLFSAEL